VYTADTLNVGRLSMVKVLGVGAGGHAKVVLEILRLAGGYEPVGLLDVQKELKGTEVLGVPVLGDDALLPELFERGVRHAFLGVGSTKDTWPRRRLYERVRALGFHLVPAIHPRSVIAPSARIGDGPTVMANAVINADARLADNVIVNTGSIVEHDCAIASHAHIATGARLAGAVYVGEGAHVGLGACVREGVRIGPHAVIAAGAVVIEDVAEGVVVAGVPARILRKVIG
jgi:UDP-perosamine 4-acetyltransferase